MVNGVEHVEAGGLGEFEIIARYFTPLAKNPAALSLLDDAALLPLPEGYELVATCDTIVEGVHFLADDPPDSIGHKALAVALSDLAAKGARPRAYLLMLAFPERPASAWLEGFAGGLRALQEEAAIDLVGGDTTATRGPLTISVTALGFVPQGEAVLRSGAIAGDRLFVSGTIGDAALGLRLLREPQLAAEWGLTEEEGAFLIDRYRRPAPRGGLLLPLRHCARAGIDVSDGLIGDVEKLCETSGVAAMIEVDRVPLSPACAKAVARAPSLLAELLTAGDDYEIVAAVSPRKAEAFAAAAQEHDVSVTPIGTVQAGDGQVFVVDQKGETLELGRKGFAHF